LRVYLSVSVLAVLLSGTAQAQTFTSPSDQDRADTLLKQMTTEEKIGQLNQPFYFKSLNCPLPA
jgi:beta-glucosidase